MQGVDDEACSLETSCDSEVAILNIFWKDKGLNTKRDIWCGTGVLLIYIHNRGETINGRKSIGEHLNDMCIRQILMRSN